MHTLTCTRGLPGSGKSTWARQQDAVRVNRDDIRFSLFGTYWGGSISEEMVTKVERAIATEALKEGRNVVVDATHLRPRYLREWEKFAQAHGAEFKVKEFDTSLEDCVRRDAKRDRVVGADVIIEMAHKYMPKGRFMTYEPGEVQEDDSVPADLVQWDPNLPYHIIVDIDGTMTMGPHDRKPHDLTKVLQDKPRRAVVNLVNRLLRDGYFVTFLSGREGTKQCHDDTLNWLHKAVDKHHWNDFQLIMRKEGDYRKDSIVKKELFDQNIRGVLNTKFVLDDRDQVVEMWRKTLGLPCFQVAYGDF
jgi:predicted kinase